MKEMTPEDMGACLMHYIMFSVKVVNAMREFKQTKDGDEVVKKMESAVDQLNRLLDRYL